MQVGLCDEPGVEGDGGLAVGEEECDGLVERVEGAGWGAWRRWGGHCGVGCGGGGWDSKREEEGGGEV